MKSPANNFKKLQTLLSVLGLGATLLWAAPTHAATVLEGTEALPAVELNATGWMLDDDNNVYFTNDLPDQGRPRYITFKDERFLFTRTQITLITGAPYSDLPTVRFPQESNGKIRSDKNVMKDLIELAQYLRKNPPVVVADSVAVESAPSINLSFNFDFSSNGGYAGGGYTPPPCGPVCPPPAGQPGVVHPPIIVCPGNTGTGAVALPTNPGMGVLAPPVVVSKPNGSMTTNPGTGGTAGNNTGMPGDNSNTNNPGTNTPGNSGKGSNGNPSLNDRLQDWNNRNQHDAINTANDGKQVVDDAVDHTMDNTRKAIDLGNQVAHTGAEHVRDGVNAVVNESTPGGATRKGKEVATNEVNNLPNTVAPVINQGSAIVTDTGTNAKNTTNDAGAVVQTAVNNTSEQAHEGANIAVDGVNNVVNTATNGNGPNLPHFNARPSTPPPPGWNNSNNTSLTNTGNQFKNAREYQPINQSVNTGNKYTGQDYASAKSNGQNMNTGKSSGQSTNTNKSTGQSSNNKSSVQNNNQGMKQSPALNNQRKGR